jgi:hypothetical protein
LLFIPGTNVVVDGFNTSRLCAAELIHVLTHFHSDHRQGLSAKFRGRLLCSRLTSEFVRGIGVKEQFIEVLDLLKPYSVQPPENSGIPPFTITFIDANHCPGSVAIILQNASFSYFVSGDIRVDQGVIRSALSVRRDGFDIGFLDSTFCDQSSKWDAIPTIEQSKVALLDFLMSSDERVAFEFELLGTEVLLEVVLERFPNQKFAVSDYRRMEEFSIVFAERPSILSRLVLLDAESSPWRFAIISRSDRVSRDFLRLRASTQRWASGIRERHDGMRYPILELDERNREAFLFFSFHSSPNEMKELATALRIQNVQYMVRPIEVDKPEAREELNPVPPPVPRRERCKRRPFVFSMDCDWLQTLTDSQETIRPDVPDDMILPTWKK